ncbi:hypothetical protein M0R45_009586 [Rubus argutus]|uniref:Uncharacterized protein n=1 Tax=Rubus argutus TaxID=59490 RepID=A0AAW1Y5F2_RUBAR
MKLLCSNPWRGNVTCRVLGALFYSTEALFSPPSPSPSLYQRIPQAGDGNPGVSIVPVLNQWLDQGRARRFRQAAPKIPPFQPRAPGLRMDASRNEAWAISRRHLYSAGLDLRSP